VQSESTDIRARVLGVSLARTDVEVILVALAAALLFAALASKDGGFAATAWLPAAVFVSLLLALTLAMASTRLRRVELVAVASLGAFTAWSALSIAWAGVKGDAWDGANRTLFYLCVFCLFVVLPWRALTAALFLAMFAGGVTAVGLIDFLRVAGEPVAHHGFFIAGRLAAPISYPNADCALFLMATFPALILASRREAPIVLRGFMLATAGVAFELALMCQSRMSLVAAPVTILFVALAGPQRLRLLATAVPVTAAVALSAPRILHVYDVVLLKPGAEALAAARTAVVATLCGLFLGGCALAALDRSFRLPNRLVRVSGAVAAALLVCAAVAGVVVLVRAVPHPVRTVQAHWTTFSHGAGYTDQRKAHLLSGGTNRYDIWRVALDEFERAPLVGVGVDNFAVDYLRHRHSLETPLYPHSIVLRVLAQTGVVGALLLACFLAAAVRACVSRRGPRAGTVVTAAAAVFVYWFVHGAADWLWEIPALGAPALACLAIAVRLGAGERAYDVGRRLPLPAIVVGAVVIVASLGFPWIAAQETAVAARTWPSDPASAYRRVDLAARLNPLSEVPAETKGLIAARSNDPALARRAFADAVARNPANWFSQLELATTEAQLGHRAAALAAVRRAAALDPREQAIAIIRDRLEKGAVVPQSLVDRLVGAAPKPTGSGR
jgi:hypothetical protein